MKYLPLLNVGRESASGSVMQSNGVELTDMRIDRPMPAALGGAEMAGTLADMICTLTGNLPDASAEGVAIAFAQDMCPAQNVYGDFEAALRQALGRGSASGKLAPQYRIMSTDDMSAFALGAARAQDGGRVLCLMLDSRVDSAFIVGGRIATEGPGVSADGNVAQMPFLGGVIGDYLSEDGLTSVARRIAGGALGAEELFDRAQGGDSSAKRTFKAFGLVAMEALMPTIRAFSPNTLVLGGSISRGHDYFAQPINSMLGAFGSRLRICPDRLGAIYGGLLRAFGLT